jgi:hypothetical protein
MSGEPEKNDQDFEQFVRERLDRIEDMLKRLLEQAMLAEQPTGRGLGH